jgi:hypothetical protein
MPRFMNNFSRTTGPSHIAVNANRVMATAATHWTFSLFCSQVVHRQNHLFRSVEFAIRGW